MLREVDDVGAQPCREAAFYEFHRGEIDFLLRGIEQIADLALPRFRRRPLPDDAVKLSDPEEEQLHFVPKGRSILRKMTVVDGVSIIELMSAVTGAIGVGGGARWPDPDA